MTDGVIANPGRREIALAGLRAMRNGASSEAVHAQLAALQSRLMLQSLTPLSLPPPPPPIDPLDVLVDGIPLRRLCVLNEHANREREVAEMARTVFTRSQRAAVSAHWSAELKAKVAASKERERCRVLVDIEDE